jgi:hypothetical protein
MFIRITLIILSSSERSYVPTGMMFQPNPDLGRLAVIHAITAVTEHEIAISQVQG